MTKREVVQLQHGSSQALCTESRVPQAYWFDAQPCWLKNHAKHVCVCPRCPWDREREEKGCGQPHPVGSAFSLFSCLAVG